MWKTSIRVHLSTAYEAECSLVQFTWTQIIRSCGILKIPQKNNYRQNTIFGNHTLTVTGIIYRELSVTVYHSPRSPVLVTAIF